MEEQDAVLIDSCARTLASLDRRASARAQMRAANSLVHSLLIPLSLPWAHPQEPVYKAVPRDIEDLPGLLTIGYCIPDQETHGKFGRLRSTTHPKNTVAATRRSRDPGVVELTTFFCPTRAQAHLASLATSYDHRYGDSNVPGELSLRMYEVVQTRKRRREAMEVANKSITLVSFRLASTSSRLSIFDECEGGRQPLFVEAMLPRTVQEGIRTNGWHAWKQAVDLGLYNCRLPPPEAVILDDAMSSNRFLVGRTRLIWTEKVQSSSQTQRAFMRSILTGDRLDVAASKRPLKVKVAIRLNGNLIYLENHAPSPLENSDGLRVSDKAANDAIAEACLLAGRGKVDKSQCSLSTNGLFFNVLGDRSVVPGRRDSTLLERIRGSFTVDSKHFKRVPKAVPSGRLRVIPPRLDCVTTEDGLVTVVCTSSGQLFWDCLDSQVQTKASLEARVTNEFAIELQRCNVCWAANFDLSRDRKCTRCSLLVHATCQRDDHMRRSDAWICQTCDDTTTQNQIHCRICRLSNGCLESDDSGWVHSICKSWCGADRELVQYCLSEEDPKVSCDLCSAPTHITSVAHCAAENCSVKFHPMCAVVASLGAELQHKSLRQSGKRELDAYLCTQFTLSMMKTSFVDNRKSLVGDSTTLPVAFCGYHNPMRLPDCCGLYPEGCNMENAMRIPPKRG
jgi:hypothetical protein